MLRVLIVDDDITKARAVSNALEIFAEQLDVAHAADSVSARRILRETTFDLLILDLNLPLRFNENPVPDGGVQLLRELTSRPGYKVPGHVLGLTAYEEVYRQNASEFGKELWSVIVFDAASDVWVEQIRAKIRHIIAAHEHPETNVASEFDLGIVTALREPELSAILNLDWDWHEHPIKGDPTMYYRGQARRLSGSTVRIVAAHAAGMGMPMAAIVATKLLFRFRPNKLVMTGICAGDPDEVNLGDVVVGNPTWDYGSGKYALVSGKQTFVPAPFQASLATPMRSIAERLQADTDGLQSIRDSFGGTKPSTLLRIHIGPMASGAAVLADAARFAEIKAHNRKVIAVEMEAYAVMAAAAEMPHPPVEALVMKGVSDFADHKKDDKARDYAAYTSAKALEKMVVELGL